MQIRRGVAAAIAAAAFMAMSLMGAGTASATTEYYWCLPKGDCLFSAGYNNPVEVKAQSSSTTHFIPINKATWDGRTVYEWQQVGTNNCLTWQTSSVYAIMYTCGKGNSEQLWWQSPSITLVNDYATYYFGEQTCLNDLTSDNRAELYPCDGAITEAFNAEV
jgi:hypothetical protein